MNGMRRALGILLVIAGPVIVAIGYRNTPSASACAMANNIARELGESATCSATPSALYFAAGAVLLIAGCWSSSRSGAGPSRTTRQLATSSGVTADDRCKPGGGYVAIRRG